MTTLSEVEGYLPSIISIAKDASVIVRDVLLTPMDRKFSEKGNVDFVTETDKAVEKEIFSKLKALFPSHKFIGEESTGSVQLTDDPTCDFFF